MALQQISELKGVTHYLVMQTDGIPLRWSGWEEYSKVVQVAALTLNFGAKAQSYIPRLLDDADESLKSVRLRTAENEIIIAPGKHVILVVFQKHIESVVSMDTEVEDDEEKD
jgi:predicted regulator of Ras-like GTPase activity (Roadblock/LC7/MglB family)